MEYVWMWMLVAVYVASVIYVVYDIIDMFRMLKFSKDNLWNVSDFTKCWIAGHLFFLFIFSLFAWYGKNH